MSRTKYQESIRRSTILPAFSQSLAEVHFHPHADFASLQVFTCERLNSVLTKEACAANFTRSNAPLSCKGCPIGAAHAGGATYRNETNRHTQAEAALGLSCIRCERNEHTATRYTGRFRLTRKHTICVSCLNRELECAKGTNSKGVAPKKWAHLKQATITIEDATSEWQTLDIGLRTGRGECERYVARIHPGCVLLEVLMGGHAVQPGEPEPVPTDWHADAVRRAHATTTARKRKPKALRIASDQIAFSEVDDCWTSRKAVEVEHETIACEDASDTLDLESIAAHGFGDSDRLPEFVQWLCEDWPTFKSAPEWEPSAADKAILNRGLSDHLVDCAVYGHPKRQAGAAAPSSPVADAVALPEVSDAVVSDSEQPENESEWAGCYIVRDGVTTYVTGYAREKGLSDEEAAIALGMCDPDYADEPQAIDSTANLKSEVCAKCTNEPPKKLTGKQQRKLKKAQRRAERQAGAPTPAAPNRSAKQIAIAARATLLCAEFGA